MYQTQMHELYYRNVAAGAPQGGPTMVPHPNGYVPALSPALASPSYGYVPATRTPTITTTTGSTSTHNPLPTPPRDLYTTVPHIANHDSHPIGTPYPNSLYYSDSKKDKKSKHKHAHSYSGHHGFGVGEKKSSRESVGVPPASDQPPYFLSAPPGPMMWQQQQSVQPSTWDPHSGYASADDADIPPPPPPVVTGWQPATFLSPPLGGPTRITPPLKLAPGPAPLTRSATVPAAAHTAGPARKKEKDKPKEKEKKKGGLAGLFRSLTHSSSSKHHHRQEDVPPPPPPPAQPQPQVEVFFPELQTSPVIGYTATGIPVHAPPGTVVTSGPIHMGGEHRGSTKSKKDKQRASAPPATTATQAPSRSRSQTAAAHMSAPVPSMATPAVSTAPTPLAQMPLLQPPASALGVDPIEEGDSPGPAAPPPPSKPRKSHRSRQEPARVASPPVPEPAPAPPPPPTSSKPAPIRFGPASRRFSSFALVSSHPVLHKGLLYPTAAHLFEAQKFLRKSDKPELAEQIREISDVVEMYQFVQTIPIRDARPDWTSIFFAKLDATIYEKMTQHSGIREELLETGSAELKYEVSEGFWGVRDDGTGDNVLGKALERVRTRILRETAAAAAAADASVS